MDLRGALTRLNEVRRQRGVSVRALAVHFNVSPVTMGNWLNRGTSAERFFALAEALGCDVLVVQRRDPEREARSAAAVAEHMNGSGKPCCEAARVVTELRKLMIP